MSMGLCNTALWQYWCTVTRELFTSKIHISLYGQVKRRSWQLYDSMLLWLVFVSNLKWSSVKMMFVIFIHVHWHLVLIFNFDKISKIHPKWVWVLANTHICTHPHTHMLPTWFYITFAHSYIWQAMKPVLGLRCVGIRRY